MHAMCEAAWDGGLLDIIEDSATGGGSWRARVRIRAGQHGRRNAASSGSAGTSCGWPMRAGAANNDEVEG